MPAEGVLRVARNILRQLIMVGVLVLAGGLLSASLVRFSPGFGVDERELDSRLGPQSIEAIRDSHQKERSLIAFYMRFLAGLFHGNLGDSHSFSSPIADLVRQRWLTSLQSILYGLPIAWGTAFLLTSTLTITRNSILSVLASSIAGALLSVPIAMLAFFTAGVGKGAGFALTLAITPILFRYVRNILESSFRKSHVVAARAKGIAALRIFWWHVLPTALPQLVGLTGVSVSMAIGALIPIEFLCDSPGIGQLALQAALTRDLPLLVSLTVIVTAVIMLATMVADLFGECFTTRAA
jgi:peptide/nickel transport system permease protein